MRRIGLVTGKDPGFPTAPVTEISWLCCSTMNTETCGSCMCFSRSRVVSSASSSGGGPAGRRDLPHEREADRAAPGDADLHLRELFAVRNVDLDDITRSQGRIRLSAPN